MKAVVLAAGKGNRMGNYTENLPKTLIPVRNKPIISHTLESLSLHGIEDVLIVTGYGAGKIRDRVGSGSRWNLKVEYIHNHAYSSTNNIYSLYLARRALEEQSFLIVNSDLLFHPVILEKLIDQPRQGISLAVDLQATLGEEEMKVRLKDGFIYDIGKDLSEEECHGEYIGLALVGSQLAPIFFSALEDIVEEKGRGVFYEEVFKELLEKGEALGWKTTGGYPWMEIDTPQDLARAEAEVSLGSIERRDGD